VPAEPPCIRQFASAFSTVAITSYHHHLVDPPFSFELSLELGQVMLELCFKLLYPLAVNLEQGADLIAVGSLSLLELLANIFQIL